MCIRDSDNTNSISIEIKENVSDFITEIEKNNQNNTLPVDIEKKKSDVKNYMKEISEELSDLLNNEAWI